MKTPPIILVIVLSFVTAFATVKLSGNGGLTRHETSYERVIRTGTLRCGYEYWDTGLMRDDKTGKLYGTWPDLLEAIGQANGIKIEWAEHVGWDEGSAALKSNKVDAICSGIWTSAMKAKETSFTTPIAYQGVEVFVRADDHRFDGNAAKLNDPAFTLAVIDSDNSDAIAQQDFPRAKRFGLGQMNGTDNDLMLTVMTGKADATFTIPGLWDQFNKSNSGKLRRLMPGHYLRVFGLGIMIDNDDPRLLTMLNTAIDEIRNSGVANKILDQTLKTYPDMYIKPNKPFP
jgi:ABC-type amino acid transport substrate-binding protein